MPRTARIIIPGIPHHVTQRGTRRGKVFFEEGDWSTYLELLKHYCDKYEVQIRAYCLMDNHVHHGVIPKNENALSLAMGATHQRYAQMINARYGWTGHLWEGRFFSSALDEDYFWTAIRYIERNPVEARMVKRAWDYRWSSAAHYCGESIDPILGPEWRPSHKQAAGYWKEFLSEQSEEEAIQYLKANTRRDRVSGSPQFIERMEVALGRKLSINRRGRPFNK